MAELFPLLGAVLFAAFIWAVHERDERTWRRQAEDERKRASTPAE